MTEQTEERIHVYKGAGAGIHPAIFDRDSELMKSSPLGDKALLATVVGLTHASSTLEEVSHAQNAITKEESARIGTRKGGEAYTGDIMMGQNGRPQVFSHRYNEFADAAEGAIDAAISEVEARRKAVLNASIEINRGLEKLLTHAETARNPDLQVQIRDRLAQMSPQKARGFVMDRIREFDQATVHAVFNAPAWLSGLKDDDLSKLRPIVYQHLDRDAYDQMTVADRMSDTLGQALKSLENKKAEVSGFRSIAAKKASDALTSLRKVKK